MHIEDTIVALASAVGPGERAVIRLSGSTAIQVANAVLPDTISGRGMFAVRIQLPGVHSSLPATYFVMPGPRSYTGQDSVEIHTISSPPLIDLLLTTLMDRGARAAQPGEFTMRAFLAGKKDLTQAEAVLAVIHAESEDDLTAALSQLAGGVKHPLQDMREDLLNLLADVEAGLDFIDEHIEFVDDSQVLLRIGSALARLLNLKRQLDTRAMSDRPFRVAFVGEPNAGKSSLFNALAGSATALVSPIAGTTRDYLTRTVTLKGLNIELIDTAGWQEATNTIEQQAQKLGREQLQRADLVLWCIEAVQSIEQAQPPELPPDIQLNRPPLIVLTKADLISAPLNQPHTSVKTQQGINQLKEQLSSVARESRPSAIASSLSRCQHHVEQAITHLRAAHHIVLFKEPQELLALELRLALDQLGEMVGAIYTNDLLDRIFSRFCIGK